MEENWRQREQAAREAEITAAAAALFINNGYEKTTMDQLALETGFTKRTLYRYFTCKEDLFFAAANKAYTGLLDRLARIPALGRGLEKVRLGFNAFYDFYTESPKMLALIVSKSTIGDGGETDCPFKAKFAQTDRRVFETVAGFFKEGREDGSIREDLEPAELSLSSIFMVTGFFNLLSVAGGTFTAHAGVEMDRFVRFAMDRMLENIQAG